MENYTSEEILQKIRDDRPNQVIHEVISFKKSMHGFYDVKVDMETMFFNTTVIHTKCMLPYPMSEYEKLTNKEQMEWRIENW